MRPTEPIAALARWLALGAVAACIAGLCGGAIAQAMRAPAVATAASSTSSIRMPTQKEMDAQRIRMPSDAELARQPGAVMPRIDTPSMPLQPGIDAGALAEQYEALRRQAEPEGERAMSGLMVFVTLQMPRASLLRLVEQAELARATLVLRGLKGSSMKSTLAEVATLIGKRKVAWMIDPESFKRYAVVLAPTFVLVAAQSSAVASCATGQCAVEPIYSKVTGDVSTAYALQAIERGDPGFKAQAQAYRARLEARK